MEKTVKLDVVNYLAIFALEKMGDEFPNQRQINAAETMIKAILKIINNNKQLKETCRARRDLIGTLVNLYFEYKKNTFALIFTK